MLSLLSAVFTMSLVLAAYEVANTKELPPSTLKEASDAIEEIIQTKYPEYCSLEQAEKFNKLTYSLKSSSDLMRAEKLHNILHDYRIQTDHICDSLWDEKVKFDAHHGKKFQNLVKIISSFQNVQREFDQVSVHSLDNLSIYFADIIEKYVARKKNIKLYTKNKVLKELYLAASKLSEIIRNNSGHILMSERSLNSNDAVHLKELYDTCSLVTFAVPSYTEKELPEGPVGTALPTAETEAYIESKYRPQLDLLAAKLAHATN